MSQTMQGPPTDDRPLTLRSIARSIEPLFPSAADELRGIATSLDPEADR